MLATIGLLCGLFGLEVVPPTEAQLERARNINRESGGFSYLVMFDGRVVAEDYPNGGGPNRAHALASGTKSFAGVLALAAQEDGLLKLDEPVSETLNEWHEDGRRTITIRQVLRLEAGLPAGPTLQLPSYREAVATRPFAQPGERFQYGGTPFMVFGEVLRRKLEPKEESVMAYLERRILRPLEIRPGLWVRDADGNPMLPHGARLTARDWAKFGEMVRQDGKGVLRPRQTRELWVASRVNPSYGLTWWLPAGEGQRAVAGRFSWPRNYPRDVYVAAGLGGQILAVIPSRKLVVVRQGPTRLAPRFDEVAFLRAFFD